MFRISEIDNSNPAIRMSDFKQKIQAFINKPTPKLDPREAFVMANKLVIIFAIFYFAIFKFNAPLHELHRDLIEFFSVAFSLFTAFLILWLLLEIYEKSTGKRALKTFGTSPVVFIFVYTVGIAILYPIKEWIWSPNKSWVVSYYWRHFPYAFLVFCAFTYRNYKNAIIDGLVLQLNEKLGNRPDSENIKAENNSDESPIALQVDGNTQNILPSMISRISVGGHYLDIFFEVNKQIQQICVRKSLTEILEELPENSFIKVHRSHVINRNHVISIQKVNRQYVIELKGHEVLVPISRNNLPNVLSQLESSR